MSSLDSRLHVARSVIDGVVLLTPTGLLDSLSYLTMRDAIIKESVDEPDLIVVVVDWLQVPAESAWAVFTSARWHTALWPDVPVVIVATDADMRGAIERNGVAPYVPCYAGLQMALAARRTRSRRRVTVLLSPDKSATVVGRTVIREALELWDLAPFVPLCCIVGTHLIEIASSRQNSGRLRVEFQRDTVTLAIDDPSDSSRVRQERPTGTDQVSDLGVLSSICRTWGTTPDRAGRRVLWAVCGAENLI